MSLQNFIAKTACGLSATLIIVLIGLTVCHQRNARQVSMAGGRALAAVAVSDSGTQLRANAQNTRAVEGGIEQLAAEVQNLRNQLEALEEELEWALNDLARERASQREEISTIVAMKKTMLESSTVKNMTHRTVEKITGQTF